MDELVKKGAVELSRLIKNGETSSEEVVKAHLKRIKEVNPEINAITISLEESALELAVKSDNASKEDKARPLHGVPFTIKENIDLHINEERVSSKELEKIKSMEVSSPKLDNNKNEKHLGCHLFL